MQVAHEWALKDQDSEFAQQLGLPDLGKSSDCRQTVLGDQVVDQPLLLPCGWHPPENPLSSASNARRRSRILLVT